MKLEEKMPTPKFLDLKPNRLLLDPKFDGYKLSLDTLPCYSMQIDGVDKVGPADAQYSIQHAKLFAHYNCLHADFWNPSLFFIIDRDWNINKISFDTHGAKFGQIEKVWAIPTRQLQKLGRYNVTIIFADKQHAVISDGCGSYFVLDTGDRMSSGFLWQVVRQDRPFAENAESSSGDETKHNFVLLDAITYDSGREPLLMDILLLRLIDSNDKDLSDFFKSHDNQYLKTTVKHPFVTSLEWITLRKDDNGWQFKSKRVLVGPSGVDYSCLESNGTGILLASENHFAFSEISDGPLKYYNGGSQNKNATGDNDKPDYVWTQNDSAITVWFKIPSGATKRDIKIDIKHSSISLTLNGELMLEGEFLHGVKADESTWIINPAQNVVLSELQEIIDPAAAVADIVSDPTTTAFQSLEIILEKAEPCLTWEGDSIIKGNSLGLQILDPEFIAEIHERLAHLCSDKWNADPLRANVCDPQQLEECDGFPADTTSFMRVDLETQCISHSASLGGHQWLFCAHVEDRKIPAICVRHDVDGVVWQPTTSNSNDWNLEHIGTFSAMGYVQASKQQRRFTVSPPDLSYVAICDAVKHVYIYRQPNPLETDLRNRRTGTRVSHIAKQQIISIDPPVEVVGAYAANDFLYILTSQNVHAYRVKEISEIY